MNKEDFISELISKTGLTEEQGNAANGVLESTLLSGNKDKNVIVSQLSEKLGIDESQANMIYNVAIDLVKDGALDKIKNIFK